MQQKRQELPERHPAWERRINPNGGFREFYRRPLGVIWMTCVPTHEGTYLVEMGICRTIKPAYRRSGVALKQLQKMQKEMENRN